MLNHANRKLEKLRRFFKRNQFSTPLLKYLKMEKLLRNKNILQLAILRDLTRKILTSLAVTAYVIPLLKRFNLIMIVLLATTNILDHFCQIFRKIRGN